MTALVYIQPRELDVSPLAVMLSQSFHFPDDEAKKFVTNAGRQVRVVKDGDEMVAGLVVHDFTQHFCGRGIPMGGIAAVGVAPHARARGVARLLMSETIRELRERGVPISTLYASTQHLYRAVGYEQAGSFFRYEAPTRSVPRFRIELEAHPFDLADTELMKSIVARAPKPNGWVDRDDLQWGSLAEPWGEDRVFAYVVGPRNDPEGYVFIIQSKGEDGFVVHAKDFVALTRAARERIWTLISDHRSLGRTCRFDGGATEPNLLLFPEQEYRVHEMDRWMLRITDVPAALASRGYPAHVDGEVHLEVTDDVVPENAGRFVLRISGGEGTVEPGGEGNLKLHVRTLAPLFTGLYPASTLQALGRLEGDTATVEAADAAFAGPEPVMVERF